MLQLCGKAPVIVFAATDMDAAVDGAMAARFRDVGQIYVCADRILLQNGIHDAFAAPLFARVATLRVGSGTAEVSQMGLMTMARP